MVPHDTDLKELPMIRRSAISVFALVVAFALGMSLSNRPAMVSAQPAGGHGKCIGMSIAETHTDVLGSYRVFRAFEDGTVETVELKGNDSAPWVKIGK